jgi:cobalt-zinc-cadmium efflux system outer membrane protein
MAVDFIHRLNEKKMRIVFVIILILSGITAFTQSEVFTLEKAIETTILQHPEIHQMDARIETAKNKWRLESGIHSPEFSFFREGIDETEKFAEQRLAIQQSFEFPLTIAHRHRAFKNEYRALEFEREYIIKRIKAEVKQSYIELLYARYYNNLMTEQMELANELLNVSSVRSEAGVGSDLELLKAQIAVAEAINDLENAELQLLIKRNQLFAVIGLKAALQPEVVAWQDTLLVDNEKLQLLEIDQIILQHPLYQATQARLEAASASLKEGRSKLFPDISASYYQQDYGNGYDFHGFEIGLQIPLWFPLERQGMVNTAKAGIHDMEWQLHKHEINIRKEIENALAGYRTSRNAIERFNETIRSRSKLLQELTIEAYRLGTADMLMVLDARQTYLQSRVKYLNALKNYYIQITEIEKYGHETIIY